MNKIIFYFRSKLIFSSFGHSVETVIATSDKTSVAIRKSLYRYLYGVLLFVFKQWHFNFFLMIYSYLQIQKFSHKIVFFKYLDSYRQRYIQYEYNNFMRHITVKMLQILCENKELLPLTLVKHA